MLCAWSSACYGLYATVAGVSLHINRTALIGRRGGDEEAWRRQCEHIFASPKESVLFVHALREIQSQSCVSGEGSTGIVRGGNVVYACDKSFLAKRLGTSGEDSVNGVCYCSIVMRIQCVQETTVIAGVLSAAAGRRRPCSCGGRLPRSRCHHPHPRPQN